MSSKLLAVAALAVISAPCVAAAVGPWGQCGGNGYNGDTTCVSGYSCSKLNDWYSQCQPGTVPPVTTTAAPVSSTFIPPVSVTVLPPVSSAAPPSAPSPSASPNSLQKRFAAKGKQYFGTCADPNTLNIAANVAVIQREFGQVTPENSMKWESLAPSRGSFNWGNSDRLVDWAVQNGKLIRGHTLVSDVMPVWHSQLPGWVNSIGDRAGLTSVIEAHIAAVAGRYAGKLLAWDVVNEMFNEDGSIRGSVFSRVLGESFVPLAFQAARRADPKAVYATPGTIDGMGTQGHLSGGQAGNVQAALNALARAVGIKEVAITELDIQGASASEYTTVVRACLNTPLCVGITVWGVSDANSWRASGNPLLFDRSYQPKAAYTSIIGIL
ncbi:hypothetical protein FA15DRAFT_654610 [Coprinopsis marcescibilis]|uniref:Endo-1,4-beta-xylanase n=1 Tax=Coprinopsis marcescibilis TaxID=230819 RepID=A0A5C3L0E2_COPMA|nr:hypothetical protein FA15DRAFT_654610 [Coprinopsis marcescibilis]